MYESMVLFAIVPSFKGGKTCFIFAVDRMCEIYHGQEQFGPRFNSQLEEERSAKYRRPLRSSA